MSRVTLFNSEDIEKSIGILVSKGDVFEIRAIEAKTSESQRPHIVQGYFDSVEKVVEELPRIISASGIYITLNPVAPSLLSRANNRLVEYKENGFGTSDKDIVKRQWLLIDCDPKRPAHISSTQTEQDASVNRAVAVYEFLNRYGWGKPVSGYSGNGFHLLYRMDLPANDEHLVERVLKSLNHLFSDDKVTVDTAVFNPSRITKLYGTKACKGDDTTDRPHRMSKLRPVPETLNTITKEMLEEIAKLHTEDDKQKGAKDKDKEVSVKSAFDVQAFTKKHNIEIRREIVKDVMTIHQLYSCPWGGDHGSGDKAGDSAIISFDSGAVTFKCFHATCSGRTWKDYRSLYEPNYDVRREEASMGVQDVTSPVPNFVTAIHLCRSVFPPKRWIVPELIPEGLTILSGKPKTMKSWLMLDVGLQIALGGSVLGNVFVNQGTVLYLALEDGQARLQERINRLLNGKEPPANIHFIGAETGWKSLDKGGLAWIEQSLNRFQDVRLIVIDTLQRIKPVGNRGRNAYENDYSAIGELQQLAISRGVGIVLVHHLRKSDSASGDIFDEVSGSLGLTGVADTNIIIKKQRNSPDATLSMTSRDATEKELAIKFNDLTCKWTLIGKASDIHLSREREDILEVMRECGGEMDASEITGGLEQKGIHKKDSTIRWHLRRMADEGLISNPVRGKYRLMANGGMLAEFDCGEIQHHQQTNIHSVSDISKQTGDQQTNIYSNNSISEGLFDEISVVSHVSESPSVTQDGDMFVCWSNSSSSSSSSSDYEPLFPD